MHKQLYDGYYKYDHVVSETYDSTREAEKHWQLEDAFIEKYLQSRHIVTLLDLPVGTGRFFHHYFGIRSVFGVDISKEMLLKARQKSSLFLSKNQICLEQGDVFNLSFSNAVFDTVIIFRLFHLMPESSLGLAIKELCRVSCKDVVVQTYVPVKRLRGTFLKRLRVMFQKITCFFTCQNSTVQTKSANPWSHIHAYFHKQTIIDAEFARYGFLPVISTLLDTYENSEVRATIYSKKN